MTTKNIFSIVLASILGGIVTLGGYHYLNSDTSPTNSLDDRQNIVLSKFEPKEDGKFIVPDGLNFVNAAEKVTPAVVHIKTYYEGKVNSYGRKSMDDMLRDFLGEEYSGGNDGRGLGEGLETAASGSGVIITNDGYIATNNHVVEGASRVEVVLDDKRKYNAIVIGTDPTTDLALLKIEEKNLAFTPYGNSDNIKVGQWVLAVGNPFDLTSTVTAGIVSAKGRNINILRNRSGLAIESFIQTDAAVNPGNSGGALVDLNGNLIGINTAIASNTGSFAGYSFAVPVNLAKKVMNDLLEYGEVRRALMGVNIQDVDAKLAEEKGFADIEGVYIAGISPKGGAEEAGIELGDVIVAVDGAKVNSVSELQELVARKRPGDKIRVEYKRDGKLKNTNIGLKGAKDYDAIVKTELKGTSIPELGGEFASIDTNDKYNFGIDTGVKVITLKDGKLRKAGVKEGFIITKVDKEYVSTPEELKSKLKGINGGVLIEGYNKDGEKEFIGVGF